MRSDKKYFSPSGKHYLRFQPDGNFLVATAGNQYLWGIDRLTSNYGRSYDVLLGGGNIVIKDNRRFTVWQALDRVVDPSARPVLTPEGVLQLVSAAGAITWASDGKLGATTAPANGANQNGAASVPAQTAQDPFVVSQSPAGVVLARSDRKYLSPSGRHYLRFQPDGNFLVATTGNQYLWGIDRLTSNYGRSASATLGGGNIVIRDARNLVIWQALDRVADPSARPVLTPEGVLQLVTPTGSVTWASDGKLAAAAPAVAPANAANPNASANVPAGTLPFATKLPMAAGTSLKRGFKYSSPSGQHQLFFADDGNVVLTGDNGSYMWGFDQVAKDLRRIDRVELRTDGSFAAYDAKGAAVWTAPVKRRDPSAQLTVSFDGALRLVTPGGEVLWASDNNLSETINVFTKPNATTCQPEPGWATCIVLADPKITIQAVALASQSAIFAVANIYTELTKRFKPEYPRNKFDGYKIYLTNGQPWSALAKLEPVGSMWPNQTGPQSGDVLRGGASTNYLWIDEQMICKRGVKTRTDAGAKDDSLRTFDQVVHEFGHAIDMRYNLRSRLPRVYSNNPGFVEMFPQSIQSWFGTPRKAETGAPIALMNEIFNSQVSFSCEGYRP
ncbi:hypothetical protein [Bryobacter aggregatus]|uniref:hypothetical protein n=1 Tax=Bryobacter aggregatus TaxID=360054 RepID=UPI0004E1F754|nr:hypothetical protein [Bryobacter aggregatus]